jgi:polar amino acid transport system permease protein
MPFDWNFAVQIVPTLLKAGIVTIKAAVLSFLLALAVGLATAIGRRMRSRMLAQCLVTAIVLVRSTPLLLQIYVIFFTLPQFGIRLDAFACGVIAIGLHYSAYTTEVYRAGFDAVPKGQWEAARALGLGTYRIYRHVILAQALPPITPVLANYLVAIFKETPLLATVAVYEIMQTSKVIAGNTFHYIEPYTIVGLFFLVISFTSSTFINRFARKLGYKEDFSNTF